MIEKVNIIEEKDPNRGVFSFWAFCADCCVCGVVRLSGLFRWLVIRWMFYIYIYPNAVFL